MCLCTNELIRRGRGNFQRHAERYQRKSERQMWQRKTGWEVWTLCSKKRWMWWMKDKRERKRMAVDWIGETESLICWREHDNWEESKGRKISSSIDQSSSSISVVSNPLLRLPLHPICTRNLDWSVLVFVCACMCVYVEVILHSVCPSLCAYISFVFIYLLMRLSIMCQCRGT